MVCGKDNIKIIPLHGIKGYKSRGRAPSFITFAPHVGE
jgi:hypothetical protein